MEGYAGWGGLSVRGSAVFWGLLLLRKGVAYLDSLLCGTTLLLRGAGIVARRRCRGLQL